MRFEYDQAKSASNKRKHGVDFDEAQSLWEDPFRLEIPAKVTGEPRFLVIGEYNGKLWSCIITYRSETIRIISARRSRKEEIELYEDI